MTDIQEAQSPERTHYKYLAVSQYYWGRGHTQEEAVKEMRKAGFSGRIGKKTNRALLFIFPPTMREPHVDSFGNVHWYDGAPDDQPEKVWL
jgi:hypothetical protein